MKIFILNTIIYLSIILSAPVDIFSANKIANNINLQFNSNDNKSQITIKSIDFIKDNDNVVIYIYHFNPTGFILIPNSDKAEPYLAYSFDSNFRKDNLPTNLSVMLDSYKNHITRVISSDYIPSFEVDISRDYFLNDHFITREYRNVSPLIDAEFDQSGSWNNILTSETGFNGPLGCVAISMGQIMHYWGYPEQGQGSNYYIEDNLGTLEADFGQAFYDFNNMAATYATNPSRLLLYHCGIAVNMDYANNGSGASCQGVYPSAEYAMKTFFKYGDSIQSIDAENYDNISEFRDILKNELDLSRPILFSGFSDTYGNGGHAWNIDGYQGNNLHCNWGWGGYNNGYYSLPSLDGFDTWQNALINLIPEIYENPLALFEYNINDDLVSFIDLSEVVNESQINLWSWDFGDNSSENNSYGFTEHTYSSPGEYIVQLTVTNIYGQQGYPHVETIVIGSSLSGDVNFDSILNVLDIVMLVSFVLENQNPTNSEFNASDLNDDNILNILDIVSLVNTILN